MQETHVVVIFSCHDGSVERLALAAAVGAVQKRASIRLRRVIDSSSEPNAETERLSESYVAPREADFAWADCIVLAVPEHLMHQVRVLGDLSRKCVLSLVTSNSPGSEPARLAGQSVVETFKARTLSNP